jgi:cobyrinic acid a,c-diamide synthase
MTRGLMIAAPRSGSGKTTVTLGLLRAFRRRGVDVVGLKSGPDYIDPAFHAAASGREGVNLDSWAMPPKLLAALAHEAAGKSALALCEASMGLFDGVPATSGRSGASADVAAALGMPILLVLDVTGQAQSAAAIVKGCATYDQRLSVAGVIVNRVGSERHRRLVADAIEALGIPLVGSLPRNDTIALPERHLGLVQAGETHALEARLEGIADFVETDVDCDRVYALAGELDWASLAQEHFAPGSNRQWPLAPPPPLWGRDGVGGRADRGTPSIRPIVRLMQQETGNGSATPLPNLPHKGGGGRPRQSNRNSL